MGNDESETRQNQRLAVSRSFFTQTFTQRWAAATLDNRRFSYFPFSLLAWKEFLTVWRYFFLFVIAQGVQATIPSLRPFRPPACYPLALVLYNTNIRPGSHQDE